MESEQQQKGPILAISGRTDPGRVRSNNEDAIGWSLDDGLAIVADGVGGHNAGEVASSMAVEQLLEQLAGQGNQHDSLRCLDQLRTAIDQANRAIFVTAQQPEHKGMSTTLVLLRRCGDRMAIAHVGDSRAYRLRNGRLERLTVDHSLVQELMDGGMMSAEEARTSSRRNLITRALGLAEEVEVDLLTTSCRPGDRFLLCSDGLSDKIAEQRIQTIMARSDEPESLEQAAEELVAAANASGGQDNIAVVLLHC